jgi:hypothetical protein
MFERDMTTPVIVIDGAVIVGFDSAKIDKRAVDCEAATTPEQAMQCCKSMHCSSHGRHGQECCKTMPTMPAPFVPPSSVHGASFSPVVFAVMAPARVR